MTVKSTIREGDIDWNRLRFERNLVPSNCVAVFDGCSTKCAVKIHSNGTTYIFINSRYVDPKSLPGFSHFELTAAAQAEAAKAKEAENAAARADEEAAAEPPANSYEELVERKIRDQYQAMAERQRTLRQASLAPVEPTALQRIAERERIQQRKIIAQNLRLQNARGIFPEEPE